MSKLVTLDFLLQVLRVTGFNYCDQIWWRCDAPEYDPATLFVNCNDFFAWGCADCEEVTPDNIGLLENTLAECTAILGKYNAYDAFLLFCARCRQERPQGAFYEYLDKKLWHLFDACGPDKAVCMGNPKPRPVEPQ